MVAHPQEQGLFEGWPDLSGWHPIDILRWADSAFGDRLMFTTAFGYSGMALLHMMSGINPRVPVFFIDTGYHFAETIQFRDWCRNTLGYNIIDLTPELPREEFEARHGADIMKRDPDFCCKHNKVAPLKRLLDEGRYTGWISALRRDQARTRAGVQPVEPQAN